MHWRGDVGAQFLHSESSVFNIPTKSRLFSVFRVGIRTLPIFCSPWRVSWVNKYRFRYVEFILDLITHHDTRHKLWQSAYLNKFPPKLSIIGVKLDTTVRSRSKNRSTCSESSYGKTNRWKTWIKRTANRRTSWVITICCKQICWSRKRKLASHRGFKWYFSANNPNGYFTHKRANEQNRNSQALLSNMSGHSRKRFDVSKLPERNAYWMGGKLFVLPIRVCN